jgi:WD40 repeat protein/uncharacterized caspase-like protein
MRLTKLVRRAACVVGLVALAAIPAEAADPAPRTPQVWAVVVGINGYPKPFTPCAGAVRDARRVGGWLRNEAGWHARHVLQMDDFGDREHGPADGHPAAVLPTRKNLDWAVKGWLAHRVKPDDVVVVYFAGHAVGLPPREGPPAGSSGRELLLPVDADATRPDLNGWAPDEALDELAARGENPVVCWLDTSLHGRGGPALAGRESSSTGLKLLGRLTRWRGSTAWLAADGRPAAEATGEHGEGPFAAALLRGMGGGGGDRRPANLLACLDRMSRDRALAGQGFRTLGGVDPRLSLWEAHLRRPRPRAAGVELLLQRGHARGVSALAFTADGDRMVSAGLDSTVKLWRVADRRLLRTLPWQMVGVTGVALSPDGALLAVGDGRGLVRVWDVSDPAGALVEKERLGAPPHREGVVSLGFLGDGKHLVTSDSEGASWLWDVTGPVLSARPLAPDHPAGITVCAPHGSRWAVARVGRDSRSLRVYDTEGRWQASPRGPDADVECLAVSNDGRRLAVGFANGRVQVHDLETGGITFDHTFPNRVRTLSVGAPLVLAVGEGRTVHLVDLDKPGTGPGATLELPGSVGAAVLSSDGGFLAARTEGGQDLRVWQRARDAAPRPVVLGEGGGSGAALSLAFSPDGRTLAVGDADGAVRAWDVTTGAARPGIPAQRGQVARLAAAPDGRALLQITADGAAHVWDLDGRRLSRVDGRWRSAAFLPDGQRVALSTRGGDVELIRRADGERDVRCERPGGLAGGFGPVAASPDGRWVAAGSINGPLACVWEAATGRLRRTIEGRHVKVWAVGFSADSRRLLTAGEDGTACLWDLADEQAEPQTFTDPEGRAITCAQVDPANPDRFATGGHDGRVRVWQAGKDRPSVLGDLEGTVHDVTFTPDGRWLVAAGMNRSMRLWRLGPTRAEALLEPRPHHAEQINALAAFPGGRVIATGSDDTTLRLWSLEPVGPAGASDGPRLLGTLAAAPGTSDWVIFTPGGAFDASPGGEAQVSWLSGGEVLSLEQFAEPAHVPGLGGKLARGEAVPAPRLDADRPPRLAIELPEGPAAPAGESALTVWPARTDLADLRLYHDGIPVRMAPDFERTPDGRGFTTRVSLHPGDNRFYVMASAGASGVDARSDEVVIAADGPGDERRMHVLAIGVGQYRREALRFARADAEQVAALVGRRGIQLADKPIVLVDERVTRSAIDDAFATLRARTKRHPNDTVVVFLAGHCQVRRGLFCLLLPAFDPRSADPNADPPPHLDPSVIPYAAIYRNLARLDARQRLVIVDACQAEAVLDDQGVRLVQRLAEKDARLARTSYLLAASPTGAASEVGALKHGLLTYVLLRGLGAKEPDLSRPPEGVPALKRWPHADFNGDGRVDSGELRTFVDLTLPELAAFYATANPGRPGAPDLTRRGGSPSDRSGPIQVQDVQSRPLPLVEIQPAGR